MREIKFRVWDKLSKKMCVVICLNCFRNDEHIVKPLSVGTNYGGDCYNQKADNLILMQYTGRKDKNIKEIYKDDIAKVLITNLEDEGEFLCKVAWDKKRTKFKLVELPPFKYGEDCGEIHCFEDVERIEIIGDIHTTPELLK